MLAKFSRHLGVRLLSHHGIILGGFGNSPFCWSQPELLFKRGCHPLLRIGGPFSTLQTVPCLLVVVLESPFPLFR